MFVRGSKAHCACFFSIPMKDINLLQDTDSGVEHGENDRQKARRPVSLTNPSAQKAPDRSRGGGLQQADARRQQMEKDQQKIIPRGPIASDSFAKNTKRPEALKTGGGLRSVLARIGSAFTKIAGPQRPPRILHAQYHDGTPAPHVAPPPPPEGKKTDAFPSGAVNAQTPFAPHRPLGEQAVPPSPPAAPQPVAQTVGKKGDGKMTAGERDVGGPTIPGVNLVPEELQGAAGSKNKLIMLGLTAGITVLLIAVAWVSILLVQRILTKQADAIRDDIAQMDSQRKQLAAQKRSAIQLHKDTLQAIDLLKKHVYWTQFFKQLEEVTVDSVSYRSVTADQAGRVTVLATGADFRSVARQLVAFQRDTAFIKDVSITSATARQEAGAGAAVDFTATLTLQPGAFFLAATPSAAASQQGVTP